MEPSAGFRTGWTPPLMKNTAWKHARSLQKALLLEALYSAVSYYEGLVSSFWNSRFAAGTKGIAGRAKHFVRGTESN